MCWGEYSVSRCAHSMISALPFYTTHHADSRSHRIKVATHSMCLTRLQNRSLFWHPELPPFLSSISLLVIIALTLSVREMNQNAFFFYFINGCKDSKRGRTNLACFLYDLYAWKARTSSNAGTGALIYSCYPWCAAAMPERWQKEQGHELGSISHLCHPIWCIIPFRFPEVS